MICYNLQNNLNGERILQDIQKLIASKQPEVLKQHILVIKLQEFSDYSGDSPLPKITYESGDSLT